MKKYITAALATSFFLTAWSSPADASPVYDEPAQRKCEVTFFRTANTEDRCRTEGGSFDVLLFRPEAAPLPDEAPLLYLLGGPGSLAAPQKRRFAALANTTGRVILVPAVGDSMLELDCHSDNAADAVWGIAPNAEDAVIYGREQQAAKLDRCFGPIRDTLKTGKAADLGTETIARQLVRLRKGFGLDGWHLFAESYGTRISLALAAADPVGTLTQTLDSPETPWEEGFWHTGANFFGALKVLSGYCRDHFYCPAKRLRLERDLLAGIAAQNPAASPAVALRDIRSGHIDAYTKPTREQLLISSFHALRTPARAAILPYIAASPKNMRERFGLLLDQLLYPGDGLNTGMHHLIRCRELPMDRWYRALDADRLSHPDMAPLLSYLAWRQQYACEALGVTPPARFAAPILADVPTLVLSGELDPVTPPDVVARAFAGSPAYAVRRYKALGHVTHAQNACVLSDVMAFWRAPRARMERSSCSGDDLSLRFYSPVIVR